MKTIGFIGGGRVVRILLQAWENANIEFENIAVYETDEAVANMIKQKFSFVDVTCIDLQKAASADWVFIALHPPVVMEMLQKIKTFLKSDALVISLSPKITIEKIQSSIGNNIPVARMNPNAGTFVNRGYNPLCFSKNVSSKTRNEFIDYFIKLGKVPVVAESKMESYAVISAMGPTYFWFQIQQLKELAMEFGLSETEAQEAISEMFAGALATLFYSGLDYNETTDLIPVKPLAEHEADIKVIFKKKLTEVYHKIKV